MLKVIRKRTAATLLMAAPHRADKTFDAATNRTDLGHADQLHPVALAVGGKRLVGGLTGSSSPVGSSLAHRLIIRVSARSTIVPTCAASRPLAAETLGPAVGGSRSSLVPQLLRPGTLPRNMTEAGTCSHAATTTSPPKICGVALASSGRFSRIQSAATSTARANMGRSRDASKGNPEPPNPQIRPATAARVRRPRGVLRVRSRLNGRPRPRAGPPRGRGSLSVSAQAVARDLGIPCSAAIRGWTCTNSPHAAA